MQCCALPGLICRWEVEGDARLVTSTTGEFILEHKTAVICSVPLTKIFRSSHERQSAVNAQGSSTCSQGLLVSHRVDSKVLVRHCQALNARHL